MPLGIQDEARDGKHGLLDAMLATLGPDALHDLTVVTFVRGTFPFRISIPGLWAFRDRVKDTFAGRGHSVECAMDGLLENAPSPVDTVMPK